jgi:hypothetical protein
MQSLEQARGNRSTDRVRVHLALWPALILLAGVVAVVQIRISLFGDMQASNFLVGLVSAFNFWLTETLPILLAGGLAIAVATRRGRLLRPACLVLCSIAVDVVAYATWWAYFTLPVEWARQAIYALSAVFAAAAWLAARGWDRSRLAASLIAGLASWVAVPHLTAAVYDGAQKLWGSGTAGQFAGIAAAYVLQVLVLSLPAITLIILRSVEARGDRSSMVAASGPADS